MLGLLPRAKRAGCAGMEGAAPLTNSTGSPSSRLCFLASQKENCYSSGRIFQFLEASLRMKLTDKFVCCFFLVVSHPESKPLEIIAPCRWVQGSDATKDLCAQLFFSLTGVMSYSFLVSPLERALFKILFVHFFSLYCLCALRNLEAEEFKPQGAKLQRATAFCKPQTLPLIIDICHSHCLCQTFSISTQLGEKFPIQQVPCEAENANVCVCCNAPPAGKTEALCREILVLSTSPFQVEYAPISRFYIITACWSLQSIKSLNLWLTWLWLSPAAHLTIHHAPHYQPSIELRMSPIRG